MIVAEWLREPDADPVEAKGWLDELREQIVAPDETPTIHASAEIEEGRSR